MNWGLNAPMLKGL